MIKVCKNPTPEIWTDALQDRLVNVIAHEYCHLANFMISGIKDSPHGKEFKEWYVARSFPSL